MTLLTDRYAAQIAGVVSCYDRIVIMGTLPGVCYAEGMATYLHGPVLARNPALADHLLARAVGDPLPALDPALLPDMPALRASYLTEKG